MISFFSLMESDAENKIVTESVRDCASRLTDEAWQYHMFANIESALSFLDKNLILDFISWDVTVDGAMDSIKNIRAIYPNSFLIIVANKNVSPLKYLRPAIKPGALLFKPVDLKSYSDIFEEILDTQKLNSGRMGNDTFLVETRDNRTRIPHSRIDYFEAREKKIFLKSGNKEYGFYSSLSEVLSHLPNYFMKCHRSYIVNMAKVKTVHTSDSLLELSGNVFVPFSKNYKKIIKEYFA